MPTVPYKKVQVKNAYVISASNTYTQNTKLSWVKTAFGVTVEANLISVEFYLFLQQTFVCVYIDVHRGFHFLTLSFMFCKQVNSWHEHVDVLSLHTWYFILLMFYFPVKWMSYNIVGSSWKNRKRIEVTWLPHRKGKLSTCVVSVSKTCSCHVWRMFWVWQLK